MSSKKKEKQTKRPPEAATIAKVKGHLARLLGPKAAEAKDVEVTLKVNFKDGSTKSWDVS